ncbi:MAG TPA: transglutaminase-like domain-containing protein [Blastocatellia bacterium]|nr:transglutaminase-like domain-containing protein [Blastocatellia bacterium]
MGKRSSRNYKPLFYALTAVCLALGAFEAVRQYLDTRYISQVARSVVAKAQATDSRSKIIALRDYLRASVSFDGAPDKERPFLRASAAETLRSGKGYCGEVTRTFINLADAVGIRAQRINLYGQKLHVVAEAEIAPGNTAIVDCQNPPAIADLEPLDKVILRPEYDDYYTLNLRRLHINWLVSRVKLEMGPFTYWSENPHALLASFWFLLAITLVTLKGLRALVRVGLRRRGWVHISNIQKAEAAAAAASPGSAVAVSIDSKEGKPAIKTHQPA